jgi:aspartyl-tRNA(Asn)/glutamyl-tRNA(Gln) amidotransferase subunit C
MALDKKTVAKVATLARLRIDDARAEQMAGELNQILGWIEQLNEVDTTSVAPMASVVTAPGKLRADIVPADTFGPETSRPKVLANAPDSQAGYFVVPKVIE